MHTHEIQVIDNFLPNFNAVRGEATHAEFYDYPAHDGEVYKRVFVKTRPDVIKRLEENFGGPIELLMMGYRLNYDDELPNHAIHTDVGWGEWAMVLYLNDVPENKYSGTAFWTHESGHTRIKKGDVDALLAVDGDWDDENKWVQHTFVPMKANRAVIYKSELFHSRWPFAAFGGTPDNGRLIAVAFFNVEKRR